MIVVATKLDATTNREHLEALRKFAAQRGLEFHAVSSASGEGIVELVRGMANALDRIPKATGAFRDETRESEQGAPVSDASLADDPTPSAAPLPGGSLTSHPAHRLSYGTRIAGRSHFLAAPSIRFTPDISP